MDEKVPDTSYGQMVDEQVNNFRVMTDAYRGEKVFQDELKRIFYRSWIFVCHESQISEPGDFKSVVVGTQPVIVSRDMSGEIHAVLNACTHRGATLVREETGTARNFVCPYHGWAFKSSGELLAISDPSRYPPDFDRSDKHLKRLRVETYGGLVFVSFNSKVEPLLDFLGGTVPHIDLWNKRTAGRKYRLGMPHRYVYAGNWKFQSENVYDGYHPGYVHRSAFETIRKFAGSFEGRYYGAVRQQGFTRGYPGGHGTLEAGTPLESGNVDPALRQGYLAELVSLNGEDVASKILLNRHIFIFPNLAVNDFNLRVVGADSKLTSCAD